jgi:hypothetical protein
MKQVWDNLEEISKKYGMKKNNKQQSASCKKLASGVTSIVVTKG